MLNVMLHICSIQILYKDLRMQDNKVRICYMPQEQRTYSLINLK